MGYIKSPFHYIWSYPNTTKYTNTKMKKHLFLIYNLYLISLYLLTKLLLVPNMGPNVYPVWIIFSAIFSISIVIVFFSSLLFLIYELITYKKRHKITALIYALWTFFIWFLVRFIDTLFGINLLYYNFI